MSKEGAKKPLGGSVISHHLAERLGQAWLACLAKSIDVVGSFSMRISEQASAVGVPQTHHEKLPSLFRSLLWDPELDTNARCRSNSRKSGIRNCHWGQKDYLPNLYSRRIILGNSMCFMCTERELLGELILKYLTKITLPKSVSN